jgi:hypothetical protein
VPDISMCTASSARCSAATRCYRNPASGTRPGDLQSWSEFEPNKGAECSAFWPTTQDSTVSMTHLERGPAPANSELSSTPIIDEWETLAIRAEDGSKHYVVRGHVTGTARFENGHLIRTSTIASIDPARRWARTQNSIYRLGASLGLMPHVIEVACKPTWREAWQYALEAMGRHTVTEWVWKTACDAGLPPVDAGRQRVNAATVAEDLRQHGRRDVAAAWQLLSVTDGSDTNAVARIYDLLCKSADDIQTPTAADAIDGWGMMARGETRDVDLSDPVAAAHRLGLPGKGKLMPLIIEMVLAPNMTEAARVFLSSVRIPAAIAERCEVNALLEPSTRRLAAAAMLDMHGVGPDDDLTRGLRLLALRATDRQGVDQVRSWLHVAFESIDHDPGEQRVYRAWRTLAFHLEPLFDPEDPIASAWHLDTLSGTDALRELMVNSQDDDEPAAPPRGVDLGPGVMVLVKTGGTMTTYAGREVEREFKAIVGKRLPLVVAAGIAGVRSKLREEFPHLHTQIDVLLSDLAEGEPIRLRPTLLVGAPGGGKSRLARRISQVIGVGLHRYDGATSMDNAFGGTARRWSTAEHCVALEAIRRHAIANPLILIDEIDKAAADGRNGSLGHALIPFLESETARSFPDPYVQADIDVSHVSYLLTANDDTALPGPLRDRLRVLRLPEPTLDHMIQLARGIIADIARENGGDERWFPDLEDGELAVVEGLWRGGSVRRLRAIVERILARRESNPRN